MRILRALSIDVVAGAACGGLLAEHMARSRMLPGWWIALLTAVWSIYTGDHLLDARRARATPLSFRHEFHRRHQRVLTALLAVAIVIGLAAAFTLRPPVRAFGLGLTAAVVLYLASAQGIILSGLPKEPMAGLLYAAGIWGGPIVMSASAPHMLLIAATLHAIAAVLNLMMIGVFEADIDRSQGARSLALKWGADLTSQIIVAMSLVMTIASIAVAYRTSAESREVFAVIALQLAAPAIGLMARAWFAHRERYRIWGDAAFFTGAVPRLLS